MAQSFDIQSPLLGKFMAWLDDIQPTPASKWIAGVTLAGSLGLLFANEPIAKLGLATPVLENPWVRSVVSLAFFSIGMLALNIALLLHLRTELKHSTASAAQENREDETSALSAEGLSLGMFNNLDTNQQEILKYLSRNGSVDESSLQDLLKLETQQLKRHLSELYARKLADDMYGMCHIDIALTKRGITLMQIVEPDREPVVVYARC